MSRSDLHSRHRIYAYCKIKTKKGQRDKGEGKLTVSLPNIVKRDREKKDREKVTEKKISRAIHRPGPPPLLFSLVASMFYIKTKNMFHRERPACVIRKLK